MTWNVDADDIFVIGSADGAVFELSISVTTPLFSEYVPVSGWLAQPVYAGEVVFVKNTATVWLVPLQKHAS